MAHRTLGRVSHRDSGRTLPHCCITRPNGRYAGRYTEGNALWLLRNGSPISE
jgi:hypothetical protein